MSKVLVAYFSATGTTKKAAEILAREEGAELFEIEPVELYTADDLNWNNESARSTVEMKDLACRPAMKNTVPNMADYDVVFLGFPIWWNREPSIVDTFLEAHDFTDKMIVPFCTSGGSGIQFIGDRIKALLGNNVKVANGKRLGGDFSPADLKTWTDGLDY